MKKSYYNITLDIKGIQSQAVLRVKQFDTSRVIYMSLTDGGKPYTIGEKCYAVFEAIKPDGTKVGNNCYIEKNKIVYEITEQTVAVSGIANCEVSLYDADGGLITSPRFTLIIDRKLVTGDEFTSSSEYTSLVECLIRAEASEKEREDAEDERRDTWNTVLDSPKVWELKGGCIYRVSGFVAIDNEGVGFYVADKSLLVVNKDGDKTLFYLYLGGYGEYPYEIVTGTTDGTTSVWYGIESDKNKVSIINKNSTYVDYPSAKAVFDFVTEILENISVEGAEQTSNKVTEITEESTDEQYPSAKAIYYELSNIKEQIIEIDNSEVLDSGKCGENLTWSLYSNGLLRISGTGRAYDYCKGILIGKTREEIEAQVEAGTIPADYAFQEGKTYDDEHGQYVSPWYKYRSEIDFTGYTSETAYNKENPNGWKYNRIIIDFGITYIGDWMFYRVSGPIELVIPEGVTKIGRWGIRYSPTLKSVVLPNSLTEIEYRGLSRHENMTNITFGRKLTTLGDNALSANDLIETIELPQTVTNIGINQFEGNDYLATARLGHITSIPSRAFVSLTSLKDVVIPEEVISIGEYAFYKCTSLERIKIPSNVATIDNNAFYLCENLRDVYIDSQTITDLITNKYSCGYLITNAERVYLKKGIASSFFETGWKYIETVDGYKKYESYETVGGDSIASGYAGASVFYTVEKTEVENEYSLTIDGSGAMTSTTYTAVPWYEYKDNIVSVSVGSGVSNMPANCFREYTNLKTAVVTCETIPNQAFYKCTSLAKVNLTGVKTIGTHAFFTTGLTEIVIPDGVTTIGQYAFSGVSTAVSVTIGKDVVEIGRNVCPNHKGSLIIPEENAIQTIGEQAFNLSQGTGTLNLPVIVTIGDKAFINDNSFEVINIGSSIESIGAQAFEMNEIATVTINRAEADITIGENAFKKIPAEKLIFVS